MAARKKDTKIIPSKLAGKPIPDHDGVPVTDTTGKIIGADGFLRETLKLDRMHLPMAGVGVLVAPFKVESHEYDFIKDGKEVIEDEYLETAVLHITSVLIVDPDLLAEVVSAHEQRIAEARAEDERARREAKGEFELPLAEGDEDTAEEGVPFKR
jgi:hypothetical protein